LRALGSLDRVRETICALGRQLVEGLVRTSHTSSAATSSLETSYGEARKVPERN